MPRLNASGAWTTGLGRYWYTENDDRLIGQECATPCPTPATCTSSNGCHIRLSDGTIIAHYATNLFRANGRGAWAFVVHPTGEYRDSFGRSLTNTWPVDVGPDGAVAVRPHSNAYCDVIEPDGQVWRLSSEGPGNQIRLLGHSAALWMDQKGFHSTVGIVPPSGDWGWPYAIPVDGQWRLLYQSYTHLALVFDGRVIATGDKFFAPDVREIAPGLLRFVWALDESELNVQHRDVRVSELASLPLVGATEPPPPPPEKPMYRDQNEIVPYLQRRWVELGVPDDVEAIKRDTGIQNDSEMTDLRIKGEQGDSAAREKHDDAERRFRAVQTPAFFEAIGELYWNKGMNDVGLGRKTGGANWEGKATDIIVLKPVNGAGQVLQIDAVSGNGYPDAHVGWSPIDFNPERTWEEPPHPSAGPVDPTPPPTGKTHRYIGGGHDTGTCDECGQPKFSPIHLVPEGALPHKPWQGEDGVGDCDICFQPVDAAIHNTTDPGEHGNGDDDPKPPSGGDMTETNRLLGEILEEQKRTTQAIAKLETSVGKAVKDLGGLLGGGGLIDILTKTRTKPKKSTRGKSKAR